MGLGISRLVQMTAAFAGRNKQTPSLSRRHDSGWLGLRIWAKTIEDIKHSLTHASNARKAQVSCHNPVCDVCNCTQTHKIGKQSAPAQ